MGVTIGGAGPLPAGIFVEGLGLARIGPDGAARKLGIPRTTLESRIKMLGIKKRRYGREFAEVFL